ncbi:MAG: hypothetical protein Q7T23_19005 [Phenylobacterium sp.]|uniref:Uncharacterized protein n=1 Tax=Phenylobacterium ferrooxidans TaxID=2982689 RepID=A0ABW6CI87_9CAUL|nr:hypothetical protein [Phenylobacterium sp.]
MADESDPELLRLAHIWQMRFGEPPPIVTDAEMIRRVLDSLPPDPVKKEAA